MKDIDIIGGIQHVGDDLVTRAEDCFPIRRHSVKGYIAAAACMLLVIAIIPIVIAKLNSASPFSTSVERLDADKYGRTFYNMYFNEENDIMVKSFRDPEGEIHLTKNLEKVLELPHEEQDLFAVTVSDYCGHDLSEVYEKFTINYDTNFTAKNDTVCPTIYVTEEQLRSMEPVEYMNLVIDSVRHEQYLGQYYPDNFEELTNEKFTKFYGEVHLNYDEYDAMRKLRLDPEETSTQDPAVLAELERYYRKFAADYGIDPDDLFAGGVTQTFGMYHLLAFPDLTPEEAAEKNFVGNVIEVALYGEFETATAERMIRDKRVQCILKTCNNSYIYEDHGQYSYPTRISEEKINEIPANTPYGEIVKKLGNTAQYGDDSLHVYLVGKAYHIPQLYSSRIIILKFDNPDEICPYSGEQLLENAVYLENLSPVRYAQSDSRWHANAIVLRENLALVFYLDRIKAVRLNTDDIKSEDIRGFDPHYDENGEINWYDERRADEREIYSFGKKLSIRESGSLEYWESILDEPGTIEVKCERIVIIPQQ